MEAKEGRSKAVRKAPYVSWKTFSDCLWNPVIRKLQPRALTTKALRERGIESDPSAEKHRSALVFLGLIHEDGSPVAGKWEPLQAAESQAYQRAVGDLVHAAYAELIHQLGKDLASVQAGTLKDEIGKVYGTARGSRDSAAAFFRGICAEAGIQIGTEAPSPRRQRTGKPERGERKKVGRAEPERRPELPAAPFQIQVAVEPGATEEQLTNLFRRVRRAWAASEGKEESSKAE